MGVVTLYQIFSYGLMIEILILVNHTEWNIKHVLGNFLHAIVIARTNVRQIL